jgi:hypothetical protein
MAAKTGLVNPVDLASGAGVSPGTASCRVVSGLRGGRSAQRQTALAFRLVIFISFQLPHSVMWKGGFVLVRTQRRRSDAMRLFGTTCGATVGLGLVFGLACAISGCDAGAGKSEYKPIDSPILKKLATSNQGQSDAAQAKLPARAKKKK